MSRRRNVDGDLSWGYWLRLENTRSGDRLVDEDGREWKSLREAFWVGRLGHCPMKEAGAIKADRDLELMLAVLIAVEKGRATSDPAFLDLFDGSVRHAETFLLWMRSVRLLERDRHEATDEGAAALRMLFATRPYRLRAIRPSTASLELLLTPAPEQARRDELRSQVEADAAALDLAFARREVGGRPAIIATRRSRPGGLDPAQVIRTVWSIDFETEERRDQLFDWLCERVDRWDDWIELAFASGADRLTRRLLSLTVVAERQIPLLTHRPN